MFVMNPSLRAAVIAEWRGLPERKMRTDRWQSPADVVPKLMRRLGLRERLHETEVIDTWSKIVGEFIAAHSAPFALREGMLQPAMTYETRTNFQARNSRKETTLRRKSNLRPAILDWLAKERFSAVWRLAVPRHISSCTVCPVKPK